MFEGEGLLLLFWFGFGFWLVVFCGFFFEGFLGRILYVINSPVLCSKYKPDSCCSTPQIK